MRHRAALVMAAVLALAGCRAKQPTQLERDEAANDASDADFAVTIKDWGRAEGQYAKAAELCPDEGDVWMNLGITRMRLHRPDDARTAYKSALRAYKQDIKLNPGNSATVLREAYVLTVLGRPEEARKVVADAHDRDPTDSRIQGFIDANGEDKMLADPAVREITP
jgi:Flp pilus assembly protein TadD